MSSTTYAKRTQYKPIDFFYRGICDATTKKVVFVDAFQILNDRYLGRMSVCNYFFIAENSVRINELNVIALDEMRNYHIVMRENFCIPDKTIYSLPITTRFLEGERDFDVLLATLKENGFKKDNLILNFNSAILLKLDDEGKARYNKLRRMGFKTCASGFGDEFNSLDIFANFTFNYLRVEASYFDASAGKKKLLNMLVKFCASNKIVLIMEGVDTPSQKTRFKKEGVKLVTGKSVSKLSRYVTNEFLGLPQLTSIQREEYLAKLHKQLNVEERKGQAEIEKLRLLAHEKSKSDIASGRVMPSAPRPELMKSPYQVRLEKQKQLAKKALLEREGKLTKKNNSQAIELAEKDKTADKAKKSKGSMSINLFEGDVQSALAVSFATDQAIANRTKKDEISVEENFVVDQANANHPVMEEGNLRNSNTNLSTDKKETVKNKNIKKIADAEKEQQLVSEIKSGNLFSQMGVESSFADFGMKLHIETAEVTVEGHYNELGQWVDEDGYIYNGYFDEGGNWVEYETFDSKVEGHYNDDGQWTDSEGNVYDGFFDENGRWIDYSYESENGEIVSNGYFDDKIKKWIPYGYFDEYDSYISF